MRGANERVYTDATETLHLVPASVLMRYLSMLQSAHTFILRADLPGKQYMARFYQALAVPLAGLATVLYALDVLDLGMFAFFTAIFAIQLIAPPIILYRINRGEVTIDPDGIRLVTTGMKVAVPWSDVSSLEVTDLASRSTGWLAGKLGVDVRRKFVELHLRTGLRKHDLVGYNLGTEGSGAKVLVSRDIGFLPEDPESFVREANELRERATPSSR